MIKVNNAVNLLQFIELIFIVVICLFMKVRKILDKVSFGHSAREENAAAPSHLTDFLNRQTHNLIRWCTPSINLESFHVKKPYHSDISVSYESLGFPLEPSGVFKAIYEHAAHAYGSDNCIFSVNGTSGSNFVVLRALAKQIPNLRILAERNVHKSVVAACEDYRINLIFLTPKVDEHLQLFFPNTEKEILEGIKKTKPQVLLLTNPTYEGAVLNLEKIIASVRKKFPDLIIFVDEAWGAHLHFSSKLPISAMDAGADICVQSTHKQGGAMQQSGMIHWNNERINTELLMDSYRNLTTTSPSYILLASLDAAREMMEKKGAENIDHILSIAESLTNELNKLEGFEVISTDMLKKRNSSIFGRDETKIILDVRNTGYSGFEISRQLEVKHKIIVEKYNLATILFVVPFQATGQDIAKTINALKEITRRPVERNGIESSLRIPTKISKILELSDVTKLLWNQIERVPLTKAVGRIAAEYITPFPPGIPITIKGEEFTREIVEYYLKLKKYPNAHISAQDKSLDTVWVVR